MPAFRWSNLFLSEFLITVNNEWRKANSDNLEESSKNVLFAARFPKNKDKNRLFIVKMQFIA
jgi:hypothetical protein